MNQEDVGLVFETTLAENISVIARNNNFRVSNVHVNAPILAI